MATYVLYYVLVILLNFLKKSLIYILETIPKLIIIDVIPKYMWLERCTMMSQPGICFGQLNIIFV